MLGPNQGFFLMLGGGLKKRLPRAMLFLLVTQMICAASPSSWNHCWDWPWGLGARLGGLGFTLLPWSRVNSLLFFTLPKEKGRSDCVGEQALSGESRFGFKSQFAPNWVTWASPFSSLSLSCKMTRRAGWEVFRLLPDIPGLPRGALDSWCEGGGGVCR